VVTAICLPRHSHASFSGKKETNFYWTHYCGRGTRWRNWLRHNAAKRKVAGSIPDGVIGTFDWHNHSGPTMALGLTQSLVEMSTRSVSWR